MKPGAGITGCSYTGTGGGAMVTENSICAAAILGSASAPRVSEIASSPAAIGVLIIELRSLVKRVGAVNSARPLPALQPNGESCVLVGATALEACGSDRAERR